MAHLTSSEQEQELGFICSLNIDDGQKALTIYNLTLDNKVLQSDVTHFFFKHKHKDLAEAYFALEKIRKHKRTLHVASGSEWTIDTLGYFNVIFNNVIDSNEICQTADLDERASTFLQANSNLSYRSFADKEGIDLANAAETDFQRKIMFVLLNPAKESCVDVMVQALLEGVLCKRFLVEQRYRMQFTISNVTKEATADMVAILFPQLYIGVIVVENKSENASDMDYQQSNAEAQMISEGIAVAQQDNWSTNIPVYMLLTFKTSIIFYKAEFTHEFVRSVKYGIVRNSPFIVQKYCPRHSISVGRSRPGLDIVNPKDRDNCIRILHSISVHITQLIPEL